MFMLQFEPFFKSFSISDLRATNFQRLEKMYFFGNFNLISFKNLM